MSEFLEQLRQFKGQQQKTTTSAQTRTLPIFLAIRDDVASALAAGYAKKTIWEHMHEIGRAPFRYETFLKHVKTHITKN